ncbi:pyrroloquinoline quinone precursor peptide PqqA [Streptomyces sp. NBC_01231]|nr:pyrroloquinoline quinone precursor peptide PqqA [Streptomyces sp. NBC_01231]
MNNTTEQSTQAQRPAGAGAEPTDRAAWQTPEYTVVDTALEVTAYSLSAR